MSRQTTHTIMMIRPVKFRYNEQTAVNNYYQKVLDKIAPEEVQEQALSEFDTFVSKLREKGVNVIVINDTLDPDTPDSIFPNNWISFHDDGRVALYPMFAPNRRQERRDDILAILDNEYQLSISEIEDFSFHEKEEKYLEGTGSMILDRPNKIVYAAISERTNEEILGEFCRKFGFKPVKFTAFQTVEGKRLPIYHTNVMMCIAETFAVICLDTIDDATQRQEVEEALNKTGKEIIEISEDQEHHFAGNMLQVSSATGDKYLVMSAAAYQSLEASQIDAIEKHCPIIHSSLDTIEALGGGSARCMMAEVFLPSH
ncbi:arginine deiminase-related protein [Fulvivirga maritima]|uniref:citrulline utilization hydrolase CtlX n=1 Tax=Fulvivirga maritima TaxID=2904247 RepID=UPI001F466AAB|nr:arginine deiminase-related protein [Fulvivirga maritima]UII24469.1 arginine deiminase-related protein [Fulvivirga maritima]